MERMPVAEKLLESSQLYDQIAPEMGFREYWYPICLAKEVNERGMEMTPLGFPVLLLRRSGKIYAIANECPHRGTRLSLGSCQFPGTNTLTCVYHGWTYDVTNGNCVAALTDGPDSPVINKVRVKTYPVTECKGIVWIWMGKEQPVAPEVDIPLGIQQADIVFTVRRRVFGNWRWHVENPGMGHAMMLHRTSAFVRAREFPGYMQGIFPTLEEGKDGVWLCERTGMPGPTPADYPGLGKWPRLGLSNRILKDRLDPLLGVGNRVSLRLPGVTRVTHFPLSGTMFHEWFVQTDREHYLYFQTASGYCRNFKERAWLLLRYYLWGRPAGMIGFNAQDISMVGESQRYANRHGGWNPPARLFHPDIFQIMWRDYAVKHARGVSTAALDGKAADRLVALRSGSAAASGPMAARAADTF